MKLTHLAPSSYRRMPWKNGLGVTTEIARAPQEGEFEWRVSIAQVTTDGPFSTFPGYDRVIVALDGDGMILTHHDVKTEAFVGPLEPWTFSGDWTTSCVLRRGAIRDFNVITRRDAFTAAVSVLHLNGPRTLRIAGTIALLYCVRGALRIESEKAALLHAEETLLFERSHDEADTLAITPTTDGTIAIQADLFALSAHHHA